MSTFVNGSQSGTINFSPLPTPNNLYFNPAIGPSGALIWDIGTLPVPASPSDILGELKYKIKITEDCFLLKNQFCIPSTTLQGFISGVGALTGIAITNQPFIQGYVNSGLCVGDPITDPISVSIDATDYISQNCQNTNVSLEFNYCGTAVTIPFNSIASNYPNGTQFYNSYPVTSSTTEYTSSNPFPNGIGTNIYYAVPPNSNGCHYRFTIVIDDIPTITSPASSTINGCGTGAITTLPFSTTPVTITLQDFINIGGSVSNNALSYTITYVDVISGTCPTVVNRNYTVSTSCITVNLNQVFTIELTDFTLPANTTSTVACAADIVAPSVPVVTDNCGNVLVASAPVVSASPTCEGNVTYTYTFTDCEGNTHNWVHTFTVDDTTPPTGIAPSDILDLQCTSEIPVADINLVTDVTDNCSGTVTVTVSETNNGGSGCNGNPLIVTRTYTLTDCSGLATNLVQTIVVEDNTAPTFTSELPVNISVSCDAIPEAQTLTASDNCDNDVFISVADSIDTSNSNCAGQYVIIRTWTATDDCNNSVTHSQTITVSDTAAPTIVTPLDTEIDVICSEIPPTPTPEFIDNCSGVFDVIHNETTNTISIYEYTITHVWTVSDNCGNEATFSQIVNVTVENPFEAITYAICIEEDPIDLFTILDVSIPTDGTWV